MAPTHFRRVITTLTTLVVALATLLVIYGEGVSTLVDVLSSVAGMLVGLLLALGTRAMGDGHG